MLSSHKLPGHKLSSHKLSGDNLVLYLSRLRSSPVVLCLQPSAWKRATFHSFFSVSYEQIGFCVLVSNPLNISASFSELFDCDSELKRYLEARHVVVRIIILSIGQVIG